MPLQPVEHTASIGFRQIVRILLESHAADAFIYGRRASRPAQSYAFSKSRADSEPNRGDKTTRVAWRRHTPQGTMGRCPPDIDDCRRRGAHDAASPPAANAASPAGHAYSPYASAAKAADADTSFHAYVARPAVPPRFRAAVFISTTIFTPPRHLIEATLSRRIAEVLPLPFATAATRASSPRYIYHQYSFDISAAFSWRLAQHARRRELRLASSILAFIYG